MGVRRHRIRVWMCIGGRRYGDRYGRGRRDVLRDGSLGREPSWDRDGLRVVLGRDGIAGEVMQQRRLSRDGNVYCV